jgi:peptidoglycan/xylan/chitin deacetylase (PgdA/CDA1 family)
MLDRLVKLIISILFFFANSIAQNISKFFGKSSCGTLVVLTYHSVKAHQRQRFEKQMKLLLKSGKAVLADVGNQLPGGRHHIAVTFDDGFQSILENALPALHKLGIPVTVFVPTGFLGMRPGWIRRLDQENYGEIVLREDQLKSLADEGVLIGSHCVTHPKVTSLQPEMAKKELIESKGKLESILGRKVTLFSFPYNDFNESVIDLAKQAGYSRTFANVPTYPISRVDRFLLGRLHVTPEDWGIEYWLKLKGNYQWLPVAISVKRKLKKMVKR